MNNFRCIVECEGYSSTIYFKSSLDCTTLRGLFKDLVKENYKAHVFPVITKDLSGIDVLTLEEALNKAKKVRLQKEISVEISVPIHKEIAKFYKFPFNVEHSEFCGIQYSFFVNINHDIVKDILITLKELLPFKDVKLSRTGAYYTTGRYHINIDIDHKWHLTVEDGERIVKRLKLVDL